MVNNYLTACLRSLIKLGIASHIIIALNQFKLLFYIEIALNQFKLLFYIEIVWAITVHVSSTVCWSGTEESPAWLWSPSKIFLEYLIWRRNWKWTSQLVYDLFKKFVLKILGSIFKKYLSVHTDSTITFGYETVSYSNLATTISLLHWISQVI